MEMIIGLSIGLPFQWAKLFFPMDCVKAAFAFAVESTDFVLFYDQSARGGYEKDGYYAIQAVMSMGYQLPQLMANCPAQPKQVEESVIAYAFNDVLF